MDDKIEINSSKSECDEAEEQENIEEVYIILLYIFLIHASACDFNFYC